MVERALYSIAFSSVWGRQMRFITGPRQSGKTTLAKYKLKEANADHLYYLWDQRSVRNRYKENELFFTEDGPPQSYKQWVCFDEIHKMPKWKNILKGIFDSSFEQYYFIVTGSAKLDIFRRAGDSLSGRYFTFHLFPLSICEFYLRKNSLSIPQKALDFIQEKVSSSRNAKETLSSLMEYGGFPEPFLRQSKVFLSKWSQDYLDTVIREDIGTLTRIIDREYLYDLYILLPQMVGSPLSESSLASHLELSHPTVKNYLRRLEDFYLAFKIHPYSKNIKRSLLKAPKCYLYDWTHIKDPGKRFENYVAVELLAQTTLWTDAGENAFELFYIRNKQQEETDFLILKDKIPWLLIEVKLSDGALASHHHKTRAMLGNIPLVQLCLQEAVCKLEGKDVYRICASRFLA